MEKFPGAHLDERAMEIRLLCDYREDQVAEINRLTNRLRWNLVILYSALEASIPPRKMDFAGQLDRVARRLRSMETCSAGADRERASAKDPRALPPGPRAQARAATILVAAYRPELLAELGCSTITAAILIGQTAGAEAVPDRRALRKDGGRRTDPSILRQTRTPPTAPRRQPAPQPRAARHRDHTRTLGPRHQGIPSTQGSRRQEPHGGPPMPQAPARTALPPAAAQTTSKRHATPGNPDQRGHLGALLDLARAPRRCSLHNGCVADARRNIELKARDPDPARSIEACRAIGAENMGTIWQRDSYFDVPFGGLKLREESPGDPPTSSSSREPINHSSARADTGSSRSRTHPPSSLRSRQQLG